jgi:hypothetical protein
LISARSRTHRRQRTGGALQRHRLVLRCRLGWDALRGRSCINPADAPAACASATSPDSLEDAKAAVQRSLRIADHLGKPACDDFYGRANGAGASSGGERRGARIGPRCDRLGPAPRDTRLGRPGRAAASTEPTFAVADVSRRHSTRAMKSSWSSAAGVSVALAKTPAFAEVRYLAPAGEAACTAPATPYSRSSTS